MLLTFFPILISIPSLNALKLTILNYLLTLCLTLFLFSLLLIFVIT